MQEFQILRQLHFDISTGPEGLLLALQADYLLSMLIEPDHHSQLFSPAAFFLLLGYYPLVVQHTSFVH